MKKYLNCIRIKHYVKNFLIFVPFLFGIEPNEYSGLLFQRLICGFFAICSLCSFIYIINDWNDREADRKHSVKCKRSIAAGLITGKQVAVMLCLFFVLSVVFIVFGKLGIHAVGYLIVYFLLNILYSKKLKHVAVIDILILSWFYVIRIYFGAALAGVDVSNWLYLTVQSLALYLSASKRFGEFNREEKGTRKVLEKYNNKYLESIMQMFLGMSLVFYALWATAAPFQMTNTIWVVILALLRYQYDALAVRESDPIEVIYKDKMLLLLIGMYIVIILLVLIQYFKA